MSIHRVQFIIDGEPTFEKPLGEILSELEVGGALVVLSASEYHTDQQRRWWKGVLLPTLAKENGDSVAMWETRLKLAVLPDDFAPDVVEVGGVEFQHVPSITKLSKRKMSALIEGAVSQLHEWGFVWATLPDAALRT